MSNNCSFYFIINETYRLFAQFMNSDTSTVNEGVWKKSNFLQVVTVSYDSDGYKMCMIAKLLGKKGKMISRFSIYFFSVILNLVGGITVYRTFASI